MNCRYTTQPKCWVISSVSYIEPIVITDRDMIRLILLALRGRQFGENGETDVKFVHGYKIMNYFEATKFPQNIIRIILFIFAWTTNYWEM